MKFIIMLTGKQAAYDAMNGKATEGIPAWTEGDLKAMFDHMGALNDDLSARGELVDAQGLVEPKQAKLVTAAADGTPIVSDGPYGESKEVLAGYWLVDVESPERAYEIAARAHRCPVPEGTADDPPVIVRPVGDPDQTGTESCAG
ncbi:YciI family protein [Streptomyces sp. NPDC051776]|uniref:YciI family protein n=1 Tax=Streptomyces sp. NPDC051776 TaxID=3155414 RepID=UPI003425829C